MSSFFLPVKGSSRNRKRKKVKQDKKVSSSVQIVERIVVNQTVCLLNIWESVTFNKLYCKIYSSLREELPLSQTLWLLYWYYTS